MQQQMLASAMAQKGSVSGGVGAVQNAVSDRLTGVAR
jgi:hypothetical protein